MPLKFQLLCFKVCGLRCVFQSNPGFLRELLAFKVTACLLDGGPHPKHRGSPTKEQCKASMLIGVGGVWVFKYSKVQRVLQWMAQLMQRCATCNFKGGCNLLEG